LDTTKNQFLQTSFFTQKNKHLFQMKGAKYNKKSLFCKEANYIPIWNKLKNIHCISHHVSVTLF
jgi:hypothetical protein